MHYLFLWRKSHAFHLNPREKKRPRINSYLSGIKSIPALILLRYSQFNNTCLNIHNNSPTKLRVIASPQFHRTEYHKGLDLLQNNFKSNCCCTYHNNFPISTHPQLILLVLWSLTVNRRKAAH